jgi:hypothetical protein
VLPAFDGDDGLTRVGLSPVPLFHPVRLDEIHHGLLRNHPEGGTEKLLVAKSSFYSTIVYSMSAETDRQGRLYIPEEIRERYGERYHIVTYEDRIELIPVADDPLAAQISGDVNGWSLPRPSVGGSSAQEARSSNQFP